MLAEDPLGPGDRERLAGSVARWLAGLHARGVYHDDFRADHILMGGGIGAPDARAVLIDVDGARLLARVSRWRRVTNLAQLYRSVPGGAVPPRVALRFLIAYASAAGLGSAEIRRLEREVRVLYRMRMRGASRLLTTLARWAVRLSPAT